MSPILATVLPVFGLIALGTLAAKTGFISAPASKALAEFVFNMALPALLFRTMVLIKAEAAGIASLWVAFFGAIAIVWVIAARLARTTPALASDGGATAGMGAGFGNIVMLGLPLTFAHFGEAGALPVSLIVSVHAPVLWLVAVLHFETSRQNRTLSLWVLLRSLGRELVRNPIVLALLLGSAWRLTGFGLTPVIDRTLALLADAGVPTALVALGLSLAGYSLKGQWRAIGLLIALKMIALPFAVWILSSLVLELPPLWTHVGVLLAAMPTGANAYLFAQRYSTATPAVSGAIAIGTPLAAATTTLVLYLIDAGMI
jgi:malonate transporter and related proteins